MYKLSLLNLILGIPLFPDFTLANHKWLKTYDVLYKNTTTLLAALHSDIEVERLYANTASMGTKQPGR